MDLSFVKELGVEYKDAQLGILNDFEFQTSVQDDSNPAYGFANVVASKNNNVQGILMSVSEDQLPLLDSYEGYPYLYSRKQLSIFSPFSNETVIAWVYLGAKSYVVKHNLKLSEIQKYRIKNGFDFLNLKYQKALLKFL